MSWLSKAFALIIAVVVGVVLTLLIHRGSEGSNREKDSSELESRPDFSSNAEAADAVDVLNRWYTLVQQVSLADSKFAECHNQTATTYRGLYNCESEALKSIASALRYQQPELVSQLPCGQELEIAHLRYAEAQLADHAAHVAWLEKKGEALELAMSNRTMRDACEVVGGLCDDEPLWSRNSNPARVYAAACLDRLFECPRTASRRCSVKELMQGLGIGQASSGGVTVRGPGQPSAVSAYPVATVFREIEAQWTTLKRLPEQDAPDACTRERENTRNRLAAFSGSLGTEEVQTILTHVLLRERQNWKVCSRVAVGSAGAGATELVPNPDPVECRFIGSMWVADPGTVANFKEAGFLRIVCPERMWLL